MNHYVPKKYNGKINTYLDQTNSTSIFGRIKYKGESALFPNDYGFNIVAPFAVANYIDGKIVYEEMTEEQKKEYLFHVSKFYNDMMDLYDKCSDKLKDEMAIRLNNVVFVYRKSKEISADYAAYCVPEDGWSNNSSFVIFTDQFLYYNENGVFDCLYQDGYKYMIESFIHECGHAYANNIADPDFISAFDRDDNSTWKRIYKTVSSNEANRQILRDYSLKDKEELFADSTCYYFTDPDKLKMVEINVRSYKTLYEYMDDILN